MYRPSDEMTCTAHVSMYRRIQQDKPALTNDYFRKFLARTPAGAK